MHFCGGKSGVCFWPFTNDVVQNWDLLVLFCFFVFFLCQFYMLVQPISEAICSNIVIVILIINNIFWIYNNIVFVVTLPAIFLFTLSILSSNNK